VDYPDSYRLWKVYDIRLYNSEQCTDQSRIPTTSAFGVTAIASGYTADNPPQYAFDADGLTTAWWAPCDYCGENRVPVFAAPMWYGQVPVFGMLASSGKGLPQGSEAWAEAVSLTGYSTADAWIGVQFDPDRLPAGGIDIQCVTIGANALVEELLWALQVYDPVSEACLENPGARECWRNVDVTRKTCSPGASDTTNPDCATEVVYVTTPMPESRDNPLEMLVLAISAILSPIAAAIALLSCCHTMLMVPDEDKREMSELTQWKTARITIALVAGLFYAIVHAAWLLITLLVSGLILAAVFAVGFVASIRMERWASTDYHLYRTSLPQSRDFWFQSLLMLALFTLINIVSSLFDLACVRYVLTILGLCVFGRDGCREPIPLVSRQWSLGAPDQQRPNFFLFYFTRVPGRMAAGGPTRQLL
ncbi:hypothetical protein FOZ63_005858, partial [Perkinsus olseni]